MSSPCGPETTQVQEYQKTEHYRKEQLGSIAMDTASTTDGMATYAEVKDKVVDS